jgi:hypothetical protein
MEMGSVALGWLAYRLTGSALALGWVASARSIARLVEGIGLLLGEEVIRVMGNITRTASEVRVWGIFNPIFCPGRRRLDNGREGAPRTYEDADPIELRLGLLVIGQIALVAVSGEPYNIIAQHLKSAAPYRQSVYASACFSPIIDLEHADMAYER